MRRSVWAGLYGVTAGAIALGIAQLVAGMVRPRAFPVIAVGDAVVDLSPEPIKAFAIRTFGTYDKVALIAGMLVLLAGAAFWLGTLSARRMGYGFAGLAVFGLVGAVAAVTRPQASVVDVVPSVAGALAGGLALWLFLGRMGSEWSPEQPEQPQQPASRDRRRLIVGVAAGLGVAGATGLVGRAIGDRLEVGAARSEVALPRPATPAAPQIPGSDLRVPGLSRFFTPNADFYRVDTAILVPQVRPERWRLRVHGLVARPIELTFDQLMRRAMIEHDVTLACVSNEVGGPYVGNARWLGTSLADLLSEAGLRSGADMLLSRSADGWTCGTPIDVVMDGRQALLAIGMNGESLPVDHGFPARMVVPGLYGYVSATKWVVDIKATRFADEQAYWTVRGWAPKADIKTQSRIDVPADGVSRTAGRIAVAGVAWAQHRGVAGVEVRVDGGQWQAARLAAVPGPDTWRQWVYDWNATPGRHRLQARATDATGHTQPEERVQPFPDGATGWHSVTVLIE